MKNLLKALLFALILSTILVGCSKDDEKASVEEETLETVESAEVTDTEETNPAGENKETTEPEITEPELSYIEDPVILNKQNIILHEIPNAKVILVGEKIENGTATLAVHYDGDFRNIWNDIEPKIKVITDEGVAADRFQITTRTTEDGRYVLYTFNELNGSKIVRIDYKFDHKSEDEPNSLTIAESSEELEVPGILEYISMGSEFPELKDAHKTIKIKEINYGAGILSVKADVTYNEDEEIRYGKIYLHDPFTEKTYDAEISKEYFAGITQEVFAIFDEVDPISQLTPYVQLHILDRKINIKLASGESFQNKVEIVSLPEEEVSDQLVFNLWNQINPFVDVPTAYGLRDAAGNVFYNAIELKMLDTYQSGMKKRWEDPNKLNVEGYSTFEATLSIRKQLGTSGNDMKLYFIADDFEYKDTEDNVMELEHTGTVLEEVTITPGKPVEVSIDTKGSNVIYIMNDIQNSDDIIVANGKLKK
jgi:hypothetical protein